jgi:hypothetical protein
MKTTKTRVAYGTYIGENKENQGKEFFLGDTVKQALKANMMVRDYEKKLIEQNPQLEIKIRIECL